MQKFNLLLPTLMGASLMLGLTNCTGGSDDPQTEPEIPPRMAATYAPSLGSFPLPNDLVFSGSEDLTLNATDSDDYSDPSVAISALDGWSAVAPFSISFEAWDTGLALDAGSVVGGTSVHVFKVNTLRSEVAPGIPAPTGPVTSVERELTAGVEYVVQATSETSIAIIPIVPFVQQAGYMVILTNELLDSSGNAITADFQYEVSKSQTAISETSSLAALEPVRQLVNAMEGAADTAGVSRDNIILSFQFTIQSIGTVMNTAKTAYIDYPLSLGAIPVTSFSSLMTDTTPFTGLGYANLYKGSLTLNYLLGIPDNDTNPTAPLNTFWTATTPTGDPSPLGENLSYANPLPKVNGVETVPLLVSMPKTALGCVKPDAGYPVAIFQHGITGDRTNALGIVDSLAAPPACTAVIAMDQPIHGIDANNPVHLGLQAASSGIIGLFEGYLADGVRERTFGVDFIDNTTGALGSDDNPDPSGSHTINLLNLLVARDNLRQAILDLLSLEKAIPFMDVDGGGADFDSSNISFIGHSLGGIVGTGFIAYSDNIKAAVLANPGGGIALMLNDSLAFGDTVRAGVAAGAGMEVTDSAFPATLAQFMFATQTVIDSGDPINTAAHALTNNVPTLLFQNLNDSVVPNSVATAPLAGTEPLARMLELTTTTAAAPGLVAGSRLFSKINQGGHSSILSPDVVTVEMQTQLVSFIASGGAAIQVSDPTLLDE